MYYYNCYYYCINYAEERRKVKADNGTRWAERTDRRRNAPERAGRKPTATIAPRPNDQTEYGILYFNNYYTVVL